METKTEQQQIQLELLHKRMASLDQKIVVSKILLIIVSLAMLLLNFY